ncbi:hypothetical protein HY469_02095 [Candidatus Roizmanbacteria bacterium]|nr:hypothetical protein [Candidatus Roizmanbacteria bacterium]
MKKKTPTIRIYRRKHFLLTGIIALLFWISFAYMFFSVAPSTVWIIGIFFVMISGALFLTTSLLVGNSRHGFLLVFVIIGYLLLRLLHQDIVINIVLLVSLAVTIELYFRQIRK